MRIALAAVGFTAPLQVMEPLGNETLLYFGLGDTQLTVRGPGQVTARVDEEVGLVFQTEHIHLFAPESGENLLLGEQS